jgi:hypothetical protein
MEETDSTSSEDEELTAQEEEQLNSTLAGLGVPNVVTDATPISIAFEPPPVPENAPSEVIQIPSDTEEGETAPPSAPEHSTLPEMITSENAAENPTEETDPDSALIVHGLVIP